MASKRNIVFQSIGADFDKNLQHAIRATLHSIDAYKPGFLTAKEFADWRNQTVRRYPATRQIFDTVERGLPKEEAYQTDHLVLEFSRFGKGVYERFVQASVEDEALVQKAEDLNRVLVGIDESSDPRRSEATLTLEVSQFRPEVDFRNKFKGLIDNLRVKFMFENHIKDTEKIAKDGRNLSKVVL